MLGHDLRGPLNAVLLTSKLISALSAGTPLSEHVSRLIRSGERMKALLDDLLDYNRASLEVGIPVSRAPVDLAVVCREEVELLRAALPDAPIELTARGPTQGSWDASRIKQVVSNLVTNAVHYGEPGGTIGVKLDGDDNEVRLSVQNTGPTIPKTTLNVMFEPLQRDADMRQQDAGENLGLGLFIVQQVALAHGGGVIVESADDRTVFTVTLPKGA